MKLKIINLLNTVLDISEEELIHKLMNEFQTSENVVFIILLQSGLKSEYDDGGHRKILRILGRHEFSLIIATPLEADFINVGENLPSFDSVVVPIPNFPFVLCVRKEFHFGSTFRKKVETPYFR